MISENIYLQYFCGLSSFTTKPVFDASLFVDIRKRMGGKEFDNFNQLVIRKSEQIKPHQSRILRKDKEEGQNKEEGFDTSTRKNRGRLKIDATVADPQGILQGKNSIQQFL